MSKAMIISLLPETDQGIDLNNDIQSMLFDEYPNLVHVFVYFESEDPTDSYWQEALEKYNVSTLPTTLVGNATGKKVNDHFEIESFYEQERFERYLNRSELESAVDRVAEMDSDTGPEGANGEGWIDLNQDENGGFGLNPFGLFGLNLPWWLVLVGGYIFYQNIKD